MVTPILNPRTTEPIVLDVPFESFTGAQYALPIRYSSHMSYKLALDPWGDEDSPYIIPSVLYYRQANVQSISAGFQIKRKSINAGLWYRGEGKQKDAFVVSLIFDGYVK